MSRISFSARTRQAETGVALMLALAACAGSIAAATAGFTGSDGDGDGPRPAGDHDPGRLGKALRGRWAGLDEYPRLFYLHYWATGDGVTLARALRLALDAINLTPPTA
jgi:Domain of Unknown Function (DUF1259)